MRYAATRNKVPAIKLSPDGHSYSIDTPFDRAFLDQLKLSVPSTQRKWVYDAKEWQIDPRAVTTVQDLIERFFNTRPDVPAGLQTSATKTVTLEIHYISRCRVRDGIQEASAMAWINEGWNAVIPESVLKAYFEGAKKGDPAKAKTLFQVLLLDENPKPEEVKSAYRRMAREWHPDVNREPDAEEMFKRINEAYRTLSDPIRFKKYRAGLLLQRDVDQKTEQANKWQKIKEQSDPYGYLAPRKTGNVTVKGREQVGRFFVEAITGWTDILNDKGEVLVAHWPQGSLKPEVKWVGSDPFTIY